MGVELEEREQEEKKHTWWSLPDPPFEFSVYCLVFIVKDDLIVEAMKGPDAALDDNGKLWAGICDEII